MKFKKFAAIFLIAPTIASCNLFTPPYLLSEIWNSASEHVDHRNEREYIDDVLFLALDNLSNKQSVFLRGSDFRYSSDIMIDTSYPTDSYIDQEKRNTIFLRDNMDIKNVSGELGDYFFANNLLKDAGHLVYSGITGTTDFEYFKGGSPIRKIFYYQQSSFTQTLEGGKQNLSLDPDVIEQIIDPYTTSYKDILGTSYVYTHAYDQIQRTRGFELSYTLNIFEKWHKHFWRDILDVATRQAYDTRLHLKRDGTYDIINIEIPFEALNYINVRLQSGQSSLTFDDGKIFLELTYINETLVGVDFDIDITYSDGNDILDEDVEAVARIDTITQTYLSGHFDIKS